MYKLNQGFNSDWDEVTNRITIIVSCYQPGFPWLFLIICFYHPLPLGGLQDYILCLYRAIIDKFLLVSQHIHIHEKGSIGETSHSLFLLFQQCLVQLIWMALEMRSKCLYNCCFVGRCFQDFLNIAYSILVLLLSSFFSIILVSVHVVHPYSSIDTTATWKKLHYVLHPLIC